MKTLKIYAVLMAIALIGFACNPIEDESLRKKYFENAGTPVSVEELNAALSVTQPFENRKGIEEGDQYVVLRNNRPDIGGVWRYETPIGVKALNSDHDTILYTSNGTFDIYYLAVSENQTVKSKTFTIEVTNFFDEYDWLLSGAEDQFEVDAKKAWKLLLAPDVAYNGMYGNWKYYDPRPGLNKWGTVNITMAMREQTLVFEFKNHKVVTYSGSGEVIAEGNWAYSHEDRGEKILGELFSTIPVPGQDVSYFQGGPSEFLGVTTPYWIVRIAEDDLVLVFPSTYNRDPETTEDWDIDATYFFFVPAPLPEE